ncbi:peptide deformylase [Ferrovum sp.]|uniref:peptide deformylase n=1 Tax=Ferrovum sp. TaxID=2609467 RepID=UPI002601EF15|nr:peptide deformylase [Ferrovum sp.]
MALLPILRYPDTRLYKKAKPVREIDEYIRCLVQDMIETMKAAVGIGLAATQVDVHLRIIVLDISKEQDDPEVFINPRLIQQKGRREHEEGCLSVPGIYDKVTRADRVVVEAWDLEGNTFVVEAEGLMATCLQHEMDHLEGRVFVDYLSQLKQNRIKSKLRKRLRETL